MKDKAIFIISLILVVAGVIYLGYTAYQFFTRDNNQEQVAQNGQEGQEDTNGTTVTNGQLSLVGNSNKELVGTNLRQGDTVSITAEIENPTSQRISSNFEGRVYSIEELYTFPDVDTEIPVNAETVPIAVNANSTTDYTYDYTINECGNFYIALASNEYWQSGRGVVSYGYYTVNCTDSFVSDTPVNNDNGEVAGVVTKGGTTPTPTPTPEKAEQLPKAGPAEDAMIIGLLAIMLGFAYRLKIRA